MEKTVTAKNNSNAITIPYRTYYQNNPNTQLFAKSLDISHIQLETGTVTDAIGNAFLTWNHETPVFIDAPTGTGKTTLIYERILKLAISKQENVLLVSNRIALNNQQKLAMIQKVREYAPDAVNSIPEEPSLDDLKDIFIFGPVGLVTYQGLESFLNMPQKADSPWLSKLYYTVFDEAHFLYSDALFNEDCGKIMEMISVEFQKTVRIYMSATSWDVLPCIATYERYQHKFGNKHFYTKAGPYIASHIEEAQQPLFNSKLLHYIMPANYSQYCVDFFEDGKTEKESVDILLDLMKPLPSGKNKWLVFVSRKTFGKAALKELINRNIPAAYIDAEFADPKETKETLVTQQRFNEAVLLATPVIDNGINIIDSNVKNIVLYSTDHTTFMQELGRRRILSTETAPVHIWVRVPTMKFYQKQIEELTWHLSCAVGLQNMNRRKYGEAVKTLWYERSKFHYRTLIYVDRNGTFRTNPYTANILQEKLTQYNLILSPENHQSYQDMVSGWLPGATFSSDQLGLEPEITALGKILSQNLYEPIPEENFQPIRQVIISEYRKYSPEYIRPDRQDTLSATSLNRFLQFLREPYTVKKCEKMWTITANE